MEKVIVTTEGLITVDVICVIDYARSGDCVRACIITIAVIADQGIETAVGIVDATYIRLTIDISI